MHIIIDHNMSVKSFHGFFFEDIATTTKVNPILRSMRAFWKVHIAYDSEKEYGLLQSIDFFCFCSSYVSIDAI